MTKSSSTSGLQNIYLKGYNLFSAIGYDDHIIMKLYIAFDFTKFIKISMIFSLNTLKIYV